MQRHLRARYLGPALVALVMIIYGAVTSVRNTRVNLSEFALVDHTRIVINELQDTLTAMLNLETGHRGYLLTGQEAFLQPYKDSKDKLGVHIEKLAGLTGDNPTQQQRVGALRRTASEKIEELEMGLREAEKGDMQAAAAIVATGEGMRQMDEFRRLVAEMEADELALLDKRRRGMVRSFKETNTIVVTTSAVAIAAGATGTFLLALYLLSRERQERLQFEKEKAQQADKAKTDFLAMMSHEIRTPLNAILGFGELLHDTVERPQEKHFANAIVTSGNSLLSLINDILDLSKIEAEKMDLHPETVEMKRFAESLETLFSFRAREKGLDYSVRLDPTVPAYLSFDALRLRQVLVNLIGNAVKFTREGHVHVTVRADTGEGDEVLLHFQVEDTGIGIAGDTVGQIFRPFYQVESEHGRHFQGTGLGLSISERLIGLMGGKINVSSELKKGSIFRVAVPVLRRMERIPEAETGGSGRVVDFNRLAPSRILVVDDVPLNRELIRGYLQGTHHEVLEAENGEQAVLLCRRHLPDVVLMDIRMPVVDGRSAHAMLKANDATKKIPLIAVTASSLLNSQEELKRMFDGFASKPISRERLYLELLKFLPVHASAATARPLPEEAVEPELHDREWPALQEKLAALRDTELPALIELVPAQATLRFAGNLSRLAEEHRCPPLAGYAMQLQQAAGNMDFTEAGHMLARFPGLIDSLSHADL